MWIEQSTRRRRDGRPLRFLALVVAGIGAGLGTARPAAPQDPADPSPLQNNLHAISRRIQTVTPRTGQAGTTVRLQAIGMPAITPVRIGIGATEVGFEEIGQALTTDRGELSLEVIVPDWTRPHLTHVFIVFDYYFVPIAVSDEFFVLAPDGTVERDGRITNSAGDCPEPALLTDEGVLYALQGNLRGFAAGDRVQVEGGIAPATVCPQGATIEVFRIRADEENH